MNNSSKKSFFNNFIKNWLTGLLDGEFINKKTLDDKINLATKDFLLGAEVDERIEEKLTPEKVLAKVDPGLKKLKGLDIRVSYSSNLKDDVAIGLSLPMFSSVGERSSRINFNRFTYPSIEGYYPHQKEGYVNTKDAEGEMLEALNALYKTQAVSKVALMPFELGITKPSALSWDDVLPKLEKVIEEFFEKKKAVATA